MPSDVKTKCFMLFVALWVLTGWICAVTGTAIAYDDCEFYCSDKYRNAWWSICFHFAVYLALIILAHGGALAAWKTTMMGFFVLIAAQMTQLADEGITATNLCYASDNNPYFALLSGYGSGSTCSDDVKNGMNVAAAGFIMLAMADYALIVHLGHRPVESARTIHDQVKSVDHYSPAPAAAPAASVGANVA